MAYLDSDGLSYFAGKVKALVNTKADSTHSHDALTINGGGTAVTSYTGNGAKTLNIVAGNNVTVTPDATNGKITIASTYTNTDTKVTVAPSTSKFYPAGSTSTSATGTLVDNASFYCTNGAVTATSFAGSGASLTSLNASNISSGTLAAARIGDGTITSAKIASLESSKLTGEIPSSLLPSYVDDVIEGYLSSGKFYKTKNSDGTYSTEIKGESGKIYTDLNSSKIYRWSGSAFAVISETLALGTTQSTAYRGDLGAAAYTHGVTNKGKAVTASFSKITSNAEGHVTGATAVTKSDITALGIPSQDTTYAAGSGITLSSGKFALNTGYTTSGKNYKVQVDSTSGGAYVNVPWTDTAQNQNAFSNIAVSGQTTVAAAATTATLTLAAGSNISITTDNTNKKVTIANTYSYTHPSSHAATMITTDATHRFVTDTQISTWNSKQAAMSTISTDDIDKMFA